MATKTRRPKPARAVEAPRRRRTMPPRRPSIIEPIGTDPLSLYVLSHAPAGIC
jgi:hypothetical protein